MIASDSRAGKLRAGNGDGLMLAANPPNEPVLIVESLFKKRSIHGESLVGPLVGAVLDTP